MLSDDLFLPDVRFTFEHYAAVQHGASWADVAAKAKRLVQQGKVTILRNAPHHVMAQVLGDGTDNGGTPDMHECEISRHDPNSQIIEQWNCSCAWAQFAFDRTRKWKKMEGRVCSHVLATYWKAKGTPLDTQDQDESYAVPKGQQAEKGLAPGQQQIPGMPFAPNEQDTEGTTPEPEGEQAETFDQQGVQPELPNEVQPPGTPTPQTPLPSVKDLTIPKQPQVAPTQPEKVPQHQQLHLFDITMPPGMQPNPSAPAISIPGGRPPTPGNPVQFPGTFSHFIPFIPVHLGEFVYSSDPMTEWMDSMRAANRPIYVAISSIVAMELAGGKIPVPGAQPYNTSSEGVPIYRVADLGWNPHTQQRENADVNVLSGAPEQTGTYADVGPGRRGEVLDYDANLKMVYVIVPLNYPEGGDVRLHPHSVKGWLDYKDVRPIPQAGNPYRK